MEDQPTMAEVLLKLGAPAYTREFPFTKPAAEEGRLKLRVMMDIVFDGVRAGGVVPHEDIDELIAALGSEPDSDRTMLMAVLIAPYVTDAMLNAAGAEAGIVPTVESTLHPKFLEAGRALDRIRQEEGEEAIHKPEHFHWFAQMMQHAPEFFIDAISKDAEEMNVLPKATHVDEAGKPVFSIEQIAEHLGAPVEEVRSRAETYLPIAAGHRGPVFPIH